MRLYDYELSGNCYKVRFLLHALNIAYERHSVNFFPGREHKSDQFPGPGQSARADPCTRGERVPASGRSSHSGLPGLPLRQDWVVVSRRSPPARRDTDLARNGRRDHAHGFGCTTPRCAGIQTIRRRGLSCRCACRISRDRRPPVGAPSRGLAVARWLASDHCGHCLLSIHRAGRGRRYLDRRVPGIAAVALALPQSAALRRDGRNHGPGPHPPLRREREEDK